MGQDPGVRVGQAPGPQQVQGVGQPAEQLFGFVESGLHDVVGLGQRERGFLTQELVMVSIPTRDLGQELDLFGRDRGQLLLRGGQRVDQPLVRQRGCLQCVQGGDRVPRRVEQCEGGG